MAENRADNLSPAQENAILALIAQTTVAKASEACGVPERTLYNWLDDPHFERAYRKARKLAFRQAISLTQRYAPMAVQTLAKVASDPNVPAAAKVSANRFRTGGWIRSAPMPASLRHDRSRPAGIWVCARRAARS